jgi:hypothetical protein
MKKLMSGNGYLIIALLVSLLLMCAGCSTTKYVPVEKVRTEYRDRLVAVHDTVRDSVRAENFIYQKDSMGMSMRGDTVFVDRWHTLRMIYYEKSKSENALSRADSSSAARVDSVEVPVAVERKLSKWEKTNQKIFDVFAIIGMIATASAAGLFGWIVYERARGKL